MTFLEISELHFFCQQTTKLNSKLAITLTGVSTTFFAQIGFSYVVVEIEGSDISFFKNYPVLPWRDLISRPKTPQAETIPLDHTARSML
jgi:hypothetical protein